MTEPKFTVGDKVLYGDDYFGVTCKIIDIFTDNENKPRYHLSNENGLTFTCVPENNFKLIEGPVDFNTSKGIEDPYDLIEYIGPELPKEPRKFEFDGYLPATDIPHALSPEHSSKGLISIIFGEREMPPAIKVKVFMTEILED